MAVENNERKRAGVRKEDDHWKLKFPRLESQRLWEKVTKIAKKDPSLKKVPLEQARMNVILRLLDGEIDDTVVHVHVYRTEDGPGFIPGVGTISVAEADRLEAFAQKVSYVDEVPDGIESYRPNQQIRDYVAGGTALADFPAAPNRRRCAMLTTSRRTVRHQGIPIPITWLVNWCNPLWGVRR